MNAKPTTVSVIIPNKNRSALLRETLDNLLNQTLKPFEIIVVDDGSTEPEYQEVVKDYGSKVVFTKNPKSGPGAARNYGLSLSTGHYIKFCDNDDVMTLNSLEVCVAELEKTGLPMVYSPYVYATSESKGNWKQKDVVLTYHPVGEKPFHDYMVRGYFTVIPAMLFTRELLTQVGPWLEETVYEDFHYLWKLTSLVPKPAHNNACCYFYRVHGNQTTGNQASDLIRDEAKVRIFRGLYDEFIPGKANYSAFTAALLHAKISDTLVQNPELPAYLRDGYQVTFLDKILKIYLQLENKLGRIQSKTDWQPFHGSNADSQVFDTYRSLLQ